MVSHEIFHRSRVVFVPDDKTGSDTSGQAGAERPQQQDPLFSASTPPTTALLGLTAEVVSEGAQTTQQLETPADLSHRPTIQATPHEGQIAPLSPLASGQESRQEADSPPQDLPVEKRDPGWTQEWAKQWSKKLGIEETTSIRKVQAYRDKQNRVEVARALELISDAEAETILQGKGTISWETILIKGVLGFEHLSLGDAEEVQRLVKRSQYARDYLDHLFGKDE